MNLKDAKKGAKVKTVGNTALASAYDKLRAGMSGKVFVIGADSVGVDFGPGFAGHNLGGACSRRTGFWFYARELKLIAKAKPAKKRARR